MLIRIAVLSFALCLVTGCSTPIATSPATNLTKSASFNTLQKTAAPSAKSQSLEAGETPAVRGFNDGYEDARVRAPRNPDQWLPQLGFSAADQQIYRQQYNQGYDSVPRTSPTPTPTPTPTSTLAPTPASTPTNSVLPARQTQLRQWGKQDGQRDIQSHFAYNPGVGITTFGLTDPTESQIYTAAYDAAYRQPSVPQPITPERRAELRQQGDNDGYSDAQLSLSQDSNRGITRLALATAPEQRAYINGYNSGYKRYTDGQPPIPGSLW